MIEKRPKQTFDRYKDEWRLNSVKGCVEKTGERIDIKAEIESAYDDTLALMLDKYINMLPNEQQIINKNLYDKLDLLREADEFALELKEQYHLDDELTTNEVIEKVSAMAMTSKQYIEEATKNAQKKNVAKSEQAPVQTDGE